MSKQDNEGQVGLSRRKFIQGTGLGVAAMGAVGVLNAAPSTSSQSLNKCKTPGCDYDVVVIGGGFSGITAARELRQDGYKVLVVEARNRLGGRTFTSEFEGHKIELGGTWVHFTQPFVWAEVERYGLELEETPGAVAEYMVVMLNGKRQMLTEEDLGGFVAAFQAYIAEGRMILERPWDLMYVKDKALAADKMSARDRLNQLELSPMQSLLMEGLLCGMGHNEPEQINYLESLRGFMLPGGDFVTLMDALARYKIKKGTNYLIDKMVEDGKPEIRLSTPVKRVEDLGDKVRVTTIRGETITAAATVLAVPMNVMPSIEFSPPLPKQINEAAKIGHTGIGYKIYMKVKGKLGKTFATADAKHPLNFVMTYKEAEDHTLMLGFGFVKDQERFDPYDDESLQKYLRDYYPEAEVLSSFQYDWVMDPYSKGTYCLYRPNWMAKYGEQFQQERLGRIFFGQGDHDTRGRGFIDGAIGAGAKVAQRLATVLQASV